ncbi:MAG: efflux RND transporter periplasmic adaptor subunit [Proteobacteria bacterium]|nr:efflux RND transporter periplasmic adaptor subunit [Pseudomonadota bacterium]MBU4055460.1 efflux RND transporter periplasmic adaptor subunit [Pseudomonadota bacterium]
MIENHTPKSAQKASGFRGRTVYFIWRNMPRALLLFFCVLTVVLFLAILEKKDAIVAQNADTVTGERPQVNVVLLPLTATEIRDSINLPGSLEPWVELNLKAKIRGTVEQVMVSEGESVTQGQILCRLESADYRIILDRAKSAYDLALTNYQREKSLYARKVVPMAQMEARETAMQAAKADLENAELNYSRCNIKSPMGGVIQSLNVKVGLLLSSGDPVGQILEIDKLKAVVGIPESDIKAVSLLDTVDITIQALDNRILKGKKHFLSPAPETFARLYRLELLIENPDGDILPGMFFRADVVKRKVPDAIAVPFYSVISRNDESFVFVEKDGMALKINVSLGIMEKWMVQVTKGLSPGDKLVVEGHRDLENHQKINVVKVMSGAGDFSL